MKLKTLLSQIYSLSTQGIGFKPHKYIALLAVIDMIDEGKISNGIVKYGEEFKLFFSKYFDRYATKGDRNRPYTPFYHLRTSGFWHLVPQASDEASLSKISSIGGPNELNRLVSHAKIDSELFTDLQNSDKRHSLKFKIEIILKQHKILQPMEDVRKTSSLFTHEAQAIKHIQEAVQSRNLGYVCSNIEIHDPQSNRYFEIDIFIGSPFGLYIVELKHWTGSIKIIPYTWTVNGFPRTDPHKGNNFKAKLVKGLCERKFPYMKLPFVESVVTLTHPEVQAEGSSNPRTTKNQPTFDSINRLIDYLKFQKESKKDLITIEDAKKIRDYIISLHQPGKPHDMQFPGYKIVDRLYQAEDRAELIARRIDVRYRSLTRLRVFFNATDCDNNEINHAFRERARSTLNAVANVGDHPNILKVWSVPNEYGHLIEGSDWSEQGTLRDLLDQQSPLELKRALVIVIGILNGLKAIHEKGVVHRNLSPENILMVEDTPKLMNFDLSYQIADNRMTVMPDPNYLIKQAYIAPEIYTNNDFTENADLFSTGILLYQMLTGKKPFKCSLDLNKSHGRLSQDCIDTMMTNKIPDNIIGILTSLVQLDRKKRPDSVTAVLEKLNQYDSTCHIASFNRFLKSGDKYEQYKIIAFIKKGAESQIYKAKGPLGEDLLIKLFNIDVPQERIIREKKMSAAVTHGSIVKAEYCQRWEDQRWLLAFKWIDGNTLNEQNKGILPDLETFIHFTRAILQPLEVMHNFKEDDILTPILHNDIKPDNIIVTPEKRPMLIDFGIASHPATALYTGTNGYVPPDSISGEDREYSVQGDLFGLGVTLFEWFFGKKPYKALTINADPINIKGLRTDINSNLEQWFLKAIDTQSVNRFCSAFEMNDALSKCLQPLKETPEDHISDIEPQSAKDDKISISGETLRQEPEAVSFSPSPDTSPNPFVTYLNTLHNRDAASGNALAENQACSKYFGHIQVNHPLTKRIKKEILENKHHVILTGHAGDGKSTIGLELFKILKNIPANKPLTHALNPCENISINGQNLAIVKDLSEWNEEKRIQFIKNTGKKNSPIMLLISNTGTLLDAFKKLEEYEGRDALGIENNLLNSFSKYYPTPLVHNGVEYLIINLAMYDNLGVARKIFDRMISRKRWQSCSICREHEKCTIYRNVNLIQENAISTERIFLMYRRLFEYGNRFTLRQLIAHMAYLLTAGMEYADIKEYSDRPESPRLSEFMFFNRFFGDNGRKQDKPAHQMKVIRTICSCELGEHPCPSWERRLWLREEQPDFKFNVRGEDSDFRLMRKIGSGFKKSVFYPDKKDQRSARKQVRRMLFFLHDFSGNIMEEEKYLSNFLCSPMLLKLLKWRAHSKSFSPGQELALKQQVLHVLQEHFTGIRLPERLSFDSSLYITLSRNIKEMQQSAQVVLADFQSKDFKIELKSESKNMDFPPYLVFRGIRQYEKAELILELPFLDYVMMRHQGETGQLLQNAFSDRLEFFKTQLIRLNRSEEDKDNIILLRLQTNHTFMEHSLYVGKNKLEVNRNA